ncbi:hypothetical protein HAX54_001819 [Datura stramonium]|uniref:Uncharacterized protein n=1 Tax=Datura stramonium TaxID=4076 RepID=A0ABS8T2X6_DATST|nr:hypothetical protein [Datura stramonium]
MVVKCTPALGLVRSWCMVVTRTLEHLSSYLLSTCKTVRAHRTTIMSSNFRAKETLFSLIYGVESLIPVEIGELRLRFSRDVKEDNNEAMSIKLDLLGEYRDLAPIWMEAQKQRMKRYYNKGELMFNIFKSMTLSFGE